MRSRGICIGGFLALWAGIFPIASKADQSPKINLHSHFFKDKLGPGNPCDPSLSLRFSSGTVVGVCRGVQAHLENGTTYYSVRDKDRFMLAAQTAAGKPSVLWHPDRHGLTQFGIQALPDQGIQLLETIQDGASTYMLFQRALVCDGRTCTLGKESCDWDLLNNLYPHAIADFNRDLDQAPEALKKDAEHLFLHGLAGDGAARARLHAIPQDFADRLDLRIADKEALMKRARALQCID